MSSEEIFEKIIAPILTVVVGFFVIAGLKIAIPYLWAEFILIYSSIAL